jgi:hypothetical protein
MRRIAPQLPAATELGEATARALLAAWGAEPGSGAAATTRPARARAGKRGRG